MKLACSIQLIARVMAARPVARAVRCEGCMSVRMIERGRQQGLRRDLQDARWVQDRALRSGEAHAVGVGDEARAGWSEV